MLEKLHEGICGSHTGGRSFTHKAFTQGYWWPIMQRTSYVRKCDQYKWYAANIHQLGGGGSEPTFQPLAVCLVGLGHSGTISSSHGKPKMAPRRDKLFY